MHSPITDRQHPTHTDTTTLTVALAGQPNVGKSTIFNQLTGMNQHVGNWPGKTVAQKAGQFTYHDTEFSVVDLPGTYSLTANSEEERIARDYIIHNQPDIVIAVVDAAIPERSLYLLAELIQLPAPIVLVLNMMDVAEQEGIQIEPHVLEAALDIPVVTMCATKNEGLHNMLNAALSLHNGEFTYNPRRPTILPAHQETLGNLITLVAQDVPAPYTADWIALKLLEGDDEMSALMQDTLSADTWKAVHMLLYAHEDAVLDPGYMAGHGRRNCPPMATQRPPLAQGPRRRWPHWGRGNGHHLYAHPRHLLRRARLSGGYRLYGAGRLHHRPLYARDGTAWQELHAPATRVWL